LWDYKIIEKKNISLPECLRVNTYSKNEIRALQDINVVRWATESRSYLPQITLRPFFKQNFKPI